MFAAVSDVEPLIVQREVVEYMESDKSWGGERMPLVRGRIVDRLTLLSDRLGDSEWLDCEFSAGDLMMISVLLRTRSSGILDEFPNLAAYVARGEERPAYKRAFAAQLKINATVQ